MDDNASDTASEDSRSSIMSFEAVIDMLPRMSTTKEIWRPPALHRDSAIPTADVKTHYNSHRGETWYELFYDLVFVASAIQIGTIIKYDISFMGLFKSGIIFTVLRATWDQLMFYQNKFDTKDLVHYIFYLGQAMFAFVIAMHLTIDDDHNWNKNRNMQALAISAGLARVTAVAMYFQVMSLTKKYRTHIKFVIASQCISAVLFFISPYAVEGEGFYYFWVASIVIERGLIHMIIACLVPQKQRAPPHFGHLAHRQGTFVLLILGEAIIQLVQSSCGNGVFDYLRGLMGFAIIFNVGDVYYQQQVVGRLTFLGTNAHPPTTLWTALHLVLSIAMLFFAVGVKVVYANDCESKDRLLKEEFLMCVSASVSLMVIFFLRMTHKGIWYKGKRVRGYSYAYRFTLSLLCSFIPYFTQNATASIGMLFAFTTCLVTQDLFSHGGPREKAISGDHTDEVGGARTTTGDIESNDLTSERLGQVSHGVPGASNNSSSFFFTDDSFGRDDFVKKSTLAAHQAHGYLSGSGPIDHSHQSSYSSGKGSSDGGPDYAATLAEAAKSGKSNSKLHSADSGGRISSRRGKQDILQKPLIDDHSKFTA